jgi:hypothetical protein
MLLSTICAKQVGLCLYTALFVAYGTVWEVGNWKKGHFVVRALQNYINLIELVCEEIGNKCSSSCTSLSYEGQYFFLKLNVVK